MDLETTIEIYYKLWFREYQLGLISIREEFVNTLPTFTATGYGKWLKKTGRIEETAVHKKYFWITISPHPDTTIDVLIRYMNDRILKKKNIIRPIYTYEQSGKDESNIGYHPHVHILCEKVSATSPKQMHNELRKALAKICAPQCIDVKVYDETYYDEKIDYLKGLKFDEEKKPCIDNDKKWRESLGLKNIYGIV